MAPLLIYEGKVAVALIAFYLFYKLLLRKETFHRLQRAVLVGTVVLAFVLPFCVITLHRTVPAQTALPGIDGVAASAPAGQAPSTPMAVSPWWMTALTVLFWAGVAVSLLRVAFSILSVVRTVRRSEEVASGEDYRVFVSGRDIDPFSWMHWIVLPRGDWEAPHAAILAHEQAHVRLHHSAELLLVDLLSAFQWFNPAIYLLRADLQEVHEFEADQAVIRSGTDLRDYQYLLIRKAVGRSGWSVANSFNHSTLKHRLQMMSRPASPQGRLWRLLYLPPLVCLALTLQARTVWSVDPGPAPRLILQTAWGEEREISREEYARIDPDRIRAVQFPEDRPDAIVITLKKPQELPEVAIVRRDTVDREVPFLLANPDTMPRFQGEEMAAFSQWLAGQVVPPADCRHSGTVKVGFIVDERGRVCEVQIRESVCAELDALVLDAVSRSPRWEPATAGGRAVAQALTVPVVFREY